MELKLPSPDEVRRAYREGEDAVVTLFGQLTEVVLALAAQLAQQQEFIEKQQQQIQLLEARLKKNSKNSSKPPSSDGYAKPKRTQSLRQPSQKPTGGQSGHEGHTLKQTAHVDKVQQHAPEVCQGCGTDLNHVAGIPVEERQVLDLPAMRLIVTAHQCLLVVCPTCQQQNRGRFPLGVKGPVQYGDGIKALATLLNVGHHLPVARTSEIICDLFGAKVSEAVILNAVEQTATIVEPVRETIRQTLIESEVLHVDETGLRVAGKLHWLHAASTDQLTWYQVHSKRGCDAMNEADILPNYQGVLVHDHWKSYFCYVVLLHALCNAHHLRELEWLHTTSSQPWAEAMQKLLVRIKLAVDAACLEGKETLPPDVLDTFWKDYERLIGLGLTANPAVPFLPGSRRRPKQTPARNLLERLDEHRNEVLRFMEDFRVPFDNNQGERDIRMVKLKQKIAGCFRTLKGAEEFATIRSYLSTARKQGRSWFQVLQDALAGRPFYPAACVGT